MNEYLERFRTWWLSLAERERRILSAGAGLLSLAVVYAGVWEPLVKAREARALQLNEARALAERLEAVAIEVQRAQRSGGPVASRGQSLLSVVDQSSKSSQIPSPSRLQPDGDNAVKIWLEDAPFEALLRWLHTLQTRHGVNVDDADIQKESGAGRVNVRLTLVRSS